MRLVATLAVLLGYALLRRMRFPSPMDLPTICLVGFLGFTVYKLALTAISTAVSAGAANLLVNM